MMQNTKDGIAKKLTRTLLRYYYRIYFILFAILLLTVTPQLYKVADNRAKDTLQAITNEIDNAQATINSYSMIILSNTSLDSSLKQYKQSRSDQSAALIEQALSSFVDSSHNLLAASLESYDHQFFSSFFYRSLIQFPEQLKEDSEYQKLFNYSSGYYYTLLSEDQFHYTNSYTGVEERHTVLVQSKIVHFSNTPYILRLYCDLNNVVTSCGLLLDNTFSSLMISNSSEEILFSMGNSLKDPDAFISLPNKQIRRSGVCHLPSGACYYSKNVDSRWNVVAYAPYIMLLQNLLVIMSIIFILYLLSPILYRVILIPTTNRLLQPLEELNDSMQSYSVGDCVELSIHTQDEIEELSNIFNTMIANINRQVNDIQHQEHVNAIINYKLLATQIDPHFIYNTMNIVNIMARQGNTTGIVEVNTALIRILRERLNSKVSIFDTLESELSTLEQYNLIMNYRYGNRVKMSVDADETLYPCIIPKNILQPLAENSFYHGFATLSDDQEGHIDILIYTVEDRMEIEISDDGIGIPKERLEMINSRSYEIYKDKNPHIGLDNIRQRLAYVYPDNHQFEIHSTYGEGTTITISLPLERDLPTDHNNELPES